MARPRKKRRDPEKPARDFNQLQRIYECAERLYRLTGGEAIDIQLRALERTQAAYTAQMDCAEQFGSAAGAWGPLVTPYESRMTSGRAAVLLRLREQKMEQCMLWAEEGVEAEAATGTAGNGTVPASGDCPRSSTVEEATSAECTSPAATAETTEPQAESKAPEAPTTDSAANDVDSPSVQTAREGQSPVGALEDTPILKMLAEIAQTATRSP